MKIKLLIVLFIIYSIFLLFLSKSAANSKHLEAWPLGKLFPACLMIVITSEFVPYGLYLGIASFRGNKMIDPRISVIKSKRLSFFLPVA